MPSMDFAYDLIEKLSEESDVDYAILVLRKGGKQDKVDFFYRFEEESKDTPFASKYEQQQEHFHAAKFFSDVVRLILLFKYGGFW